MNASIMKILYCRFVKYSLLVAVESTISVFTTMPFAAEAQYLIKMLVNKWPEAQPLLRQLALRQ